MSKQHNQPMTRRTARRMLTTLPEIVALDQTAYVTFLTLGLELAYEGKTVAKVRLATAPS